MKRVLVLGGAGFVGSHIVRRLMCDESIEHVCVVDKDAKRLHALVGELHDGNRLRAWIDDLSTTSNGIIAGMTEGIDTVFHLAANADISKAVTDPDIDFRNGTLVTRNILEAMRQNNVGRIVYFSGSGVYGEPPSEAGFAFAEDYGPCVPTSPYGAAKLASEALISAYCAMFGMTGLVFRPANIVGPGQTHGVGFDFLRKLAADPTRLEVMGNGSQTKSYVHVDDVLAAVFHTIRFSAPFELPGVDNNFQVYNVASRDRISVRAIAAMACNIAGADPVMIFGESDRGWAGDIPVVALDVQRLRAIGWQPKVNSWKALDQSMRAMWQAIRVPQATVSHATSEAPAAVSR